MYKLANQVLDASDDIGHEILRKFASKNPKINILTPDERNDLSDDQFALSLITKKASRINKFPIESYDSTWLSNEYFNETHYRLPDEAKGIAAYHIKSACEKHGIKSSPAVEYLSKEASVDHNMYFEGDLTKNERVQRTVKLDLEKFAEVQQIGDNYTHAQFVFATPQHVKVGNQYFDEYSEKMPLEYRHKYAYSLQKRAGELSMQPLKGKVTKYASNHYSAALSGHLSSRKSLLNEDTKYTGALNKLAQMKET